MCSLDSKTVVGDGHEGVYSERPFLETFCFQSSHAHGHLKRYVIFDRSGGKGRVFLHPALARDVFNSPSPDRKESGDSLQLSNVEEAKVKLQSFRETVTAAFASLQSARSSRQSQLIVRSVNAEHSPTERYETALTNAEQGVSEQAASGSLHENTENLDALLSWEEEDDEEVRSTGHSPDERSEEGTDESQGEEEQSRKRRRVEWSHVEGSQHQESKNMEQDDNVRAKMGSSTRLKIQKTVKALRKMLPGGAYLDPALVLDETILYLEALRARVHQLQSARFQIPPCS